MICPAAVVLDEDAGNVYFLDQGSSTCDTASDAGALYRVPIGGLSGAQLPAPLVSGLSDPQGLVVDGTAVYWVTGGTTGAVMMLAK